MQIVMLGNVITAVRSTIVGFAATVVKPVSKGPRMEDVVDHVATPRGRDLLRFFGPVVS